MTYPPALTGVSAASGRSDTVRVPHCVAVEPPKVTMSQQTNSTKTRVSKLRRIGIPTALIAAVALLFAMVVPTSASADATGTISGHITDAVAGGNLAGVEVRALTIPPSSFPTTTLTDASGNYTLAPPTGDYTIFASDPSQVYEANSYGGASNPTTVTASVDTPQTGIDFSLTPDGSVSGTVLDAQTGNPLANVTVVIVDAISNSEVAQGNTASDGTFRVGNNTLEPGIYVVEFIDSAENYLTTWFGGTRQQDATLLFIGTSENKSLGTKFLTLKATIGGTALDTANQPINNLPVTLTTQSGSTVETTNTDSTGQYGFNDLVAGSYFVEFGTPGDATWASQWWDGASTRALASLITVIPGQTSSNIDAVVETSATISGNINDAFGVVSGATVDVYDLGTTHKVATATSGVDGNFSAVGLRPGSYELDVTAGTHQSILDPGPIVLEEGSNSTGNDVTMVRLGNIAGSVVNEQENPISGIAVEVRTNADVLAGNATTGINGSYNVTGLVPGDYTVSFSRGNATPPYLPYTHPQTIHVTGAGPVAPIQDIVSLGVSISGTTTDASRAPLEGTTVTLYDSTDQQVASAVSDIDGNYSFLAAPGNYFVGFTPADGNTYEPQYWTAAIGGTPAQIDAVALSLSAGAISTGINARLQKLPSLQPSTPLIVGTPKLGTPLTAQTAAWGPGSVTLTYQWYLQGAAIFGATNVTYTPISGDAGKTLTVKATGAESGYLNSIRESAPSAIVTGGVLATATPVITGTKAVGQTLTANATWSPGTITYHYQWKRGSSAISHATSATYRLASADGGQKISVVVTGTEPGYTTVARTSATATIGRVLTSTPTPKITGTHAVGHKLTANPGLWKPSVVTLHYQWYQDGSPIPSATRSTYLVKISDSAHTITVRVTGSKTGYTSITRTSAGVAIA
jgi:5-hydroxyisourate hydrolase-like protein (transthyretin family)